MISRVFWVSGFSAFLLMMSCASHETHSRKSQRTIASSPEFPIETAPLGLAGNEAGNEQASSRRCNVVRMIAEGKRDEAAWALELIAPGAITPLDPNRRPAQRSRTYRNYYRALFYSYFGKPKEAWMSAQAAMDQGIPLETFLAGPRSLTDGLLRSAEFKAASQGVELLHGPMMASVTEQSASVWIRTRNETDFVVEVLDSKTDKDPQQFAAKTLKSGDFTGIARLNGLKADTKYFYRVKTKGGEASELHSFRTHPSVGAKKKYTMAFGGGSALGRIQYERIWDTIRLRQPQVFLQLGDNTFIDDPTGYEHQRSNYYRRHSRPEYRRLMASVSQAAIYNERDFSKDGGVWGNNTTQNVWKKNSLKIFKENFVSPYYGDGTDVSGAYTSFSVGDVEVFVLDTRFFREHPLAHKNPDMLGAVQAQWLKEKLLKSPAKFKVIASTVPFSKGVAVDDPSHTWDGYSEEREELYDFIVKNSIAGVFFISGDQRRADARKITAVPESGYPFYEFLNSRLTNVRPAALSGAQEGSEYLVGYNDKPHFGLLSFDFEKSDPTVTYTIVDIDNNEQGQVSVPLSELRVRGQLSMASNR